MTLDAVALLKGLCATPSLSTLERPAVELMIRAAEAAGIRASIDGAGNFVAERGSGPRTLIFLGHIDTVPGEIPVRIENGRLHGRGAVDAKGPLAAALVALGRLPDDGGLRAIVIGAVEEEASSSKGAWYVRDRYRPDYAIVGEPSGVAGITLGYKGRVSLGCRVERPMEHSAAAGKSAAAIAVNFWNVIDAFCTRFNGDKRPADTIDPHLASFNTHTDPFVEAAELAASFRLPVGFDLEHLRQAAAGAASEVARGSSAGSSDVAPGFSRALSEATFSNPIPPFKADKRNALVRAFLQAIRRHDLEPVFKFKTGTSDMNIVGPAWQCPIVAYGPGDSRLDHTPQEHVRVEEYLKAIEVLHDVMRLLAGSRRREKVEEAEK